MIDIRVLKKFFAVALLLMAAMSSLVGNSLVWDFSGPSGAMGKLDLLVIDPNQSSYLGRLVYQGEANNTLTFMNLQPFAVGADANFFYYTVRNEATAWRRVYFTAVTKAMRHDGSLFADPANTLPNLVIDNPGDTLVIPFGAGSELLDPSDPSYIGGYDLLGNWGSSPIHIYQHRFKYIWIEMTVFTTNTFNTPKAGAYESNILISGAGMTMHLALTGNKNNPAGEGSSYSFELERVAPNSIPFNELLHKNSESDSYLVGYVRYYSTDAPAKVFFAADAAGSSVDFKFTSSRGSFPYHVVYGPIVPVGTRSTITSINNRFFSTSNLEPFSSPITGAQQGRYTLKGEIRIFIPSTVKNLPLPADSYSSRIYVLLVSN